MILKRDSALFSFAQLYKNQSICRNDSTSLCELFWWTVHSLGISIVLVAIATLVLSFTGFTVGFPILSVSTTEAFIYAPFVVKLLAVFMGFAIWAVSIAVVLLLAVGAFKLGQSIGKVLPKLKPNIDPDKLSFLTVVPEYIMAKKRKICPIVQIK